MIVIPLESLFIFICKAHGCVSDECVSPTHVKFAKSSLPAPDSACTQTHTHWLTNWLTDTHLSLFQYWSHWTYDHANDADN